MIQDIQPHIYDNAYHPRRPEGSDIVLDYREQSVLLKTNREYFTVADLHEPQDLYYLFSIDEKAYYLGSLPVDESAEEPIAIMRTMEPREAGFAGITGWQLWKWLRQHRYCGCCGAEMQQDSKERAMRCPECGEIVYPVISPAVIVGILSPEGKMLMTKYAKTRSPHQRYALVAGYAEIGETIEQTVSREVMEETGLQVTNIRYYKSQPWSFSGTLLFGFWCDVVGSEEIHLDEEELWLAEWKNRDDEMDLQSDISLTGEMIRVFRSGGVSYGH